MLMKNHGDKQKDTQPIIISNDQIHPIAEDILTYEYIYGSLQESFWATMFVKHHPDYSSINVWARP